MSLFMKLKLIIPIKLSEKKIIIMPAIIRSIFEFVKKNFPIKDAVEPNVIKTKEKPKVKKIVLITIKFFFLQQVYPKMFLKYMKYNQVLMGEHKEIKN